MAGYLGSVPVPQATQHRETFTATAAQTSFATAGYTPQFVDVYLNGVHLSPADVTATNGSDVVLTACLVNDIVDVVSYTPFEVADQTFTGTTTMDVAAITGSLSGALSVNSGTANVVATFTSTDTEAQINLVDTTGSAQIRSRNDLRFFTNGGSTRAMDITSAGLVGINRTDPNRQLSIQNTLANSGGQIGLTSSDSSTSGSLGIIHFGNSTDSSLASIGGLADGSTSAGALLFKTEPAGGNIEETMRINSVGAVTMPKQPAFQCQASTLDNITSDGNTQTIPFNEVFDVGANFASNTFTAPVTGKYQLNVGILLQNADSAAGHYQLQLVTSNRIYYETVDPDYGQDSLYLVVQIAVLADMDVGDGALVKILQSGGTAQTDINTTTSKFSGFLAC